MLNMTLPIGVPLVGALLYTLFGVLMFFTALFLILLVLIQRGRGGGLSGAFGGAGGQSAFGTKAGDTFTRITIVAATFWILLCTAAILMLGGEKSVFGNGSIPIQDAGRVVEIESTGPDSTGPDSTGPGAEATESGIESEGVDSGVSPAESDVPAGSSESAQDDTGGS